jgi:flagellin-like protein
MVGLQIIVLSDINMFLKGEDSGVSEVIGAVVLIAVVMTGMSLISVILLSTPSPESQPQVSLSVSCCKCSVSNQYTLLLYHNGGDDLSARNLLFFLNTDPPTSEWKSISGGHLFFDRMGSCNPGGVPWNINPNSMDQLKSGQYLQIVYADKPKYLTVEDISTNTQRIILNSSFSCDDACQS